MFGLSLEEVKLGQTEVTQSNLQHSENKNGLALGNETHSLFQAAADFSTATDETGGRDGTET